MTIGNERAIVVLSGGLDSATCMGIAAEIGYTIYPITFDYGQRHVREVANARDVAVFYHAQDRHRVVSTDFFNELGGNALTDMSVNVPNQEDAAERAMEEVPVTYVPGRNLMFLAMAASYAETIGATQIYIGVNAVDYSGYPDCRPEFIAALQQVLTVGTKVGKSGSGSALQLQTPLIYWTKAEIIQEGMRLEVPYHFTTSCYIGAQKACGKCDSCMYRLKGFEEAGYVDPIAYDR